MVMHVIYLSEPIKYTTQKVNPNVNYELMLIVFYQYWLINCNICTTQMQDVKNRGNREEKGYMGTFCTS